MKWIKKWDSGYLFKRLFDDKDKLVAEVQQQHGDEHLYDARLCRQRPYQDLGEYESEEGAFTAVYEALQDDRVLTAAHHEESAD